MREINRKLDPTSNHLLSKLSRDHLMELAQHLEPVHTAIKDVTYVCRQPMPYVYFPCTAVHSILTYMHDGAAVESSTVGREGLTGVELLIGAEAGISTCVCQVAGDNMRMRTADFLKAIDGSTPLRRLAQCYFQAYMSQVTQSVACNRMHTVEARFARWILLTHDRVQADEFHITHEFVADMLGVHRPSVSLVANALQQAGIIRYSRGNMKVLDRGALEDKACECYEVVRAQFTRLLGIPYG